MEAGPGEAARAHTASTTSSRSPAATSSSLPAGQLPGDRDGGPWVSPLYRVPTRRLTDWLGGQSHSPAQAPGELPGILPAESLHSGVLGPVLPARDPTPACSHLAKGDTEAPAQRSQRANLSTLAWPPEKLRNYWGPSEEKAWLCRDTLSAQLQAPPLGCANLGRPPPWPSLFPPRSKADTVLLTDRGTGASGERGHGDGARALPSAAGRSPAPTLSWAGAQNLGLLQAASPDRFSLGADSMVHIHLLMTQIS